MNKKTLSVIVFLMSFFTACNMAGPELNSPGHEQSPGNDGKVAVRIQVEGDGISARTVRPNVLLADVSKWILSGGKVGNPETPLQEFTATSDTIYLEAGSWNFTLEGYNASNAPILSGSLQGQTIAETDANSLAFIVAPIEEGTGTVKLTVTMPAGFISRVDVAREGTVPTSKTPSPVSGDSTREFIDFEAQYGTGSYYFIIKLWKDTDLYGVVSELVYVRKNLTSEKTYDLERADLNLTYIINYHEWTGLGTNTHEEYYRKTDADITPPTPPANVTDYVFKGWYETTGPLNLNQEQVTPDEPDGNLLVTLIDPDDMEHKHYYPYWKLVTVPTNLSLADSLTWISNHAEPNQTYTITVKADETIAPHTLDYSVQPVGITLIGDSTERKVGLSSVGSLFTVGDGVTLTLGNNVTLQGRSDNTASLVQVNSGGTLVMESGSKITGNTTTTEGGAVFVDGGTFEMNGGAISGNTSTTNGGGVFVDGGTFTMDGGAISGNTSTTNGGGVYVAGSAEVTMNGGTISGNDAANGGGVSVAGSAEVTMNGGTISGNDATNGGGVSVESSGTFTMDGGAISGNDATNNGGGVFVASGGTFTKTANGNIHGSNAGGSLANTAGGDAYGQAVYAVDGSKRHNTTVGTGVTLNSGTTTNWEYQTGVAITLKPVTGDPTFSGSSLSLTLADTPSFSVPSGYSSYQWYWNAEAIPGATSNTYSWVANERPDGIYELSVRVVTTGGEGLSAHCRVTIDE